MNLIEGTLYGLSALVAFLVLRAIYAKRFSPTKEPYLGTGTLMLFGVGPIQGRFFYAMRFDFMKKVAQTLVESLDITPEQAKMIEEKHVPFRFAVVETIDRFDVNNALLPKKTLIFTPQNIASPPYAYVIRREWSLPTMEAVPNFMAVGKGLELPAIAGWNIIIVTDVIDMKQQVSSLSSGDISALKGYAEVYAKVMDTSSMESLNTLRQQNRDLKMKYDETQDEIARLSAENAELRIAASNPELEERQEDVLAPRTLSGPWVRILMAAAAGFGIFYQFLSQYFQKNQQQAGVIGAAVFGGIALFYYWRQRRL